MKKTFLVYQIDFTARGFIPSGGQMFEAESPVDALHVAGFKEAIGDKHVTEFNTTFQFPTRWVEARDPNESFWLLPIED